MQLRRRPSEGAEVAAESLNDIMFFLLLFFLIVSTLANPNVIKLMLPNSKTPSPERMQKHPIQVSVTSDLRYYIDKKEIPKDKLEQELTRELKQDQNGIVVLRLDRDLKVQDLVDILSVGEKLKIKMVMASAPKKG